MSELKAAVIGLGVGERHISGYEADPRCKVVALCDTDPEKLEAVAARNPGRRLTTSPEDILDDPSIDVVSIASPDDAHHYQVMRALTANKHVFVEKPLCLHLNEWKDIKAALAARPQCRMSSNLILRKAPRFQRLYRDIRAGVFGRLYNMEGDYNYGRVHKITDGWRGHIPFYSVMHGGGIHLIDLLTWLSGGRVAEVSAFGTNIATQGTAFRHPDSVTAILKFEDGMIAKISSNFSCIMPHFHNVAIYGTQASFLQTPAGAHLYTSRDPEAVPEAVREMYPGAQKGDMIPAFIGSILDNSAPDVTSQEVLDCMAVSLAIVASAEAGTSVRPLYDL